MIRLLDALSARVGDRPALVRALCACARQHRPSMADPALRAVIEAAEAWAAGGPPPRIPHDLPGGVVVFPCAAAIGAPEAEVIEMVSFFALQVPTLIWMASPDGRLWRAENDPLTPVGQDAEARRHIAATEARLVRRLSEG